MGQSYGGIAFQMQNGTDNDAEAYQGGSAAEASNYSEQNQTGDRNVGVVFQNPTTDALSIGGGNYGRQDQTGNDNTAGLVQGGTDNKAYQRQFGNNNMALSSQIGDCNVVNTYQGGNNNWASTTQSGMDNKTLIVQKGGHSYSAVQGGSSNITNVLQLGPNGNPATDGEDCIIPDQLIPQNPLTIPGFDIADPCPGC